MPHCYSRLSIRGTLRKAHKTRNKCCSTAFITLVTLITLITKYILTSQALIYRYIFTVSDQHTLQYQQTLLYINKLDILYSHYMNASLLIAVQMRPPLLLRVRSLVFSSASSKHNFPNNRNGQCLFIYYLHLS